MLRFVPKTPLLCLLALSGYAHVDGSKPVLLARNAVSPQAAQMLDARRAVFTVTGKVTGEDGSPLPGVSILIKGSTTGTTASADGTYRITLPNENATLVFSFVGYEKQEIPVRNRSVIDVTLLVDTKSLQEVVVVGYGTVKKSDVTGSVSSISSKQLQAVPVQNLSQAMQGRAAGVDIAQTSARPGAAPQIRVRGNRSLNATNNPLFVLDGIPLSEGSSINDFNPNDIESIEVLKDASATAIYGARGANGVILVTSKKGKKGKARINYDGFVGFSKPLAPLEMMDGATFAELRRNGVRGDGNATNYTTSFPNPAQDFNLFKQDPVMWESVAMGYEWEDKEKLIPKYRQATAAEKEAMAKYGYTVVDQVPIYDPSKVRSLDWTDLVLRTGVQQSHQLSVSGGSDNVGVTFSMGYFDQEGIQKGQGFTRYSSRLGLDYQVTPGIKIGGAVNMSFQNQEWGTNLYGEALGQLPLVLPYDAAGNVIIQPGGDAQIYNPIPKISGELDNRRTTRIMGTFYADVTLLKGLRYRMNFGPDLRNYRRGYFMTPEASRGTLATPLGRYEQDNRFNYVLENLLYYDKNIGDNQTLSFTALQSIQSDRYEYSNLEVDNLPYTSQLWYNLGSTNGSGPRAFGSDYRLVQLMSYMGRVNYTLNNKYLITATGRFDGSSVLAPGNKWDFFPSFAFGWKIHEEDFLKAVPALNELKLRLGYGRTGNSAVGPYSTGGGLSKTRYVWGETAAWGFVPNLIPNPDLKWEATGQVDLGIDFGLFNDRLRGSVDVYRANTTDLIMDRQIPTASGFASIQSNIGSTRNTGVELTLNSVNIDRPNGLRWTTDLTLAKNKEEITKLYGGTKDDIGNRWFIGSPVISYYDYKVIGVWQTSEAEEAAKYYPTDTRNPFGRPGLGRPKFADLNNDGKIDATNDRTIVGNNVPKIQGGLNNTFSYKGIDLSIFVFGRLGQTVLNSYLRPTLTGRYPEPQFISDHWTPTNPTNYLPAANADSERPVNADAYLYADGSFLKVRTATLAYNFPAKLLSKVRLGSVNVYATATNPFLFTKFNVTDPEFISASRNFNDQIFGVNLTEKTVVFGLRIGL
ncbi:SusC/RagA family TonB-linked outer membrane protein [Tellurirhabdus rosea]|uniref:SusC/RagA family TonB-linked outer membrane protein n=1 Tax=Tellurirhabdus rosea TaxID=2674997 RepID=UPI0022568976|nr:TonB-dependent receptor [Tellurirhabdus rosea]